jgi:2-polyprenyl-3-methyl-5-hydroxy-6-metoxy-1,4-benzoquinol methylase
MADDARGAPLPWIVQWAGLVAPEATVLDLAAGRGRHALLFAERGSKVVALDRDISRLPLHANIEPLATDLEDGSSWPLPGRRFGAAVVTNYLHAR